MVFSEDENSFKHNSHSSESVNKKFEENRNIKLNKTKVDYCKGNGEYESESLLKEQIKPSIVSKKRKEEETDSKPDVPSISFFTLYRFASCKDIFYIITALLCSIVSGCMMPVTVILFSNISQSMVDYDISFKKGTPEDDVFLKSLRFFALWNSVAGLVFMVLSYIATVLMNIAAFNQIYKIRQEYLKAALNQDFGYVDMHQMGDFAAKMSSDVIKLEDGIGEKVATSVFYLSCSLSSIITALILGWKLALLCLISFPVTFGLLGISGWLSSRLSKDEALASGKAGAVAEEVLSSIRTVYAFSGQQKEMERYEIHLNNVRKINIKKGFYNGLSMGILFFCIFGSYALSFWFGYKLTVDEPDIYNVATMIAVFMNIIMASENFSILSSLVEVFGVACGAGAQIFNLIDNVPTVNPLLNQGVVPDHVDGSIELKNVVFHYPSKPDVPVLKGISLSVKRGQSVALVGHSGCGKSTIIQLISRYYDVIDGSVCVDDNDVRELSVRWLRDQIGLVGQEPVLFNTTIRENIRYGRENAKDSEIEACAKQANAHEFIIKLPAGYDTLVGERGASLSGGQKQRIAIARALIRNPHILLLDEATSALDTSSEAKVQKALDKAQEGRTTIIVAHRLSTIRNVDVIYVFKSGEILEYGNHDELMKKKGHYYDMVMIQAPPTTDEYKDKPQYSHSMETSEKDEDEIVVPKTIENNEVEETERDISFWEVVRLNSPEWRSITVASACSVISGFAMPVLAVVFGDFVGVFSNPNSDEVLSEVQRFVIIFVIAGIFSGIGNFCTVYFYGVAGEYLTERLRKLLFGKLLQQEVAYYDDKNNSTGALCAKLAGEAAQVQAATGQRIGTVLQAAGTFIFALVLSLYFEWRVGLVAFTSVPLMAAIVYKEGRMVSADSFGTAKTMEASSKLAVEAVANMRTVASLGKEKMFLNKYAVELLPALIIAKRSAHWRGIVFGLSRGLFNFIYAAAMYYGGILIVNEHINYSIIIKSVDSLILGAASAAQAFAFAPNFHKGIKAAGRVITLLKLQSKITDPPIPEQGFNSTGSATLQGVYFKYPTRPNIQVLKDMNLTIDQGQTLALVGASGCGKSTVIQLLQRYYDPDVGIVTQSGIPLPKLSLADARRSIGFVQQEPILFDRTIGENIAYGDNSRQPSMDEIIEAAKQANIHNFIKSLPLGYDSSIGSKGAQLSGGQKQRVAIARALLRNPQILLLDEATSALDTESEKVVQEALSAASAGRTCVTIAHRLSTVRDADRICVLSDGRLHEAGTHSELMQLKGLYYNLYRTGNS